MGVTLLGKTPDDIRVLYDRVRSVPVLRVKNTYQATVVSDSNYRDIKMWPAIETGIGKLLVEVQLILASSFQEKKWMHLPYAFVRGDFDWGYTTEGRSAEDLFREGWRLYHGIDGDYDDVAFKQAKTSLVDAARRGHFLARGLCYKEGWARVKDDARAMADFKAAAEMGRNEGKIRVAIMQVNAITNYAQNRKNAMRLLREAAAGDDPEPEAMYQLGVYEQSMDDQKNWLQRAKRLGHRRAENHPLLAAASR